MNHVSFTWLRRLRWALVIYSMVGLLGFVLLAIYFRVSFTINNNGFRSIILGIIALQAIYEIIATFLIKQQHYWVKALCSFLFAVTLTIIITEVTGTYGSPLMFGVFGLAFIGSAISVYAPVGIVGLLMGGLVLSFLGVLNSTANSLNAIGSIVLTAVFGGIGFIVWRRYFINHSKVEDSLSSSLTNEQAKSDIILGAIEDGVVLIDSNQNIRLFNPAAGSISGWSVQEATGIDYHLVLKLVDEKNVEYNDANNPFSKVLREEKTVRDNTAVLVSRSDKRILLDISVSPLFDNKNNLTGAVGVFRDVSVERSEEKRRGDFISTASHEMRTPVAAIEGYLALALNDHVSKIDSKARDYLEKAHTSTEHLGKLFQDLLTSAKAEDGRLSNHPLAVEMGEFAERLTEDLRFSAEKKGLKMEFVVGTSDKVIDASGGNTKVIKPFYYVFVDPERLREVITNLFDNAVKYTETGTVSIGLTGNNQVVQLYVHDTGPGIPAEDVPHLFQKFYRVDSSATRTIGGTGLGLFICRKIVELYNGRIWVESELNKGSTFFINLPRITAERASQLQAAEATNTTAVPMTTSGTS
jgi:PAS domain S-box-containing protein